MVSMTFMTSTSCHVLHVAGHCLARIPSSVPRPLLPIVACDPSTLKPYKCLQWRRSQTQCIRSHYRRRILCTKPMQSYTSGRTPSPIPSSQNSVYSHSDSHVPRIICIRGWGSEMKWFILTTRSMWRLSRGVDTFCQPRHHLRSVAPAVYCAAGLN